MKTKLENIALEGTCNGDVVGGYYRGPRKTFRRFCFCRKGVSAKAKKKGCPKKEEFVGNSQPSRTAQVTITHPGKGGYHDRNNDITKDRNKSRES